MSGPGRRRSQRGVVLVQVLVMSLILGYIAAMILRLVLQPAIFAVNLTESVSKAKTAESAINRVQAAWAEGGVCASNAALGVNCGAGGCGCTCTVAGLPTVSSSGGANGSCKLVATAP